LPLTKYDHGNKSYGVDLPARGHFANGLAANRSNYEYVANLGAMPLVAAAQTVSTVMVR